MFNPFKKKRWLPFVSSNTTGVKPIVLVVYDGWGIAPPSEGNSISKAKTPNMDRFYVTYPHGELIASGESVGLPANEEGNSEVGHLTIGAGTVILQSLKRINSEIEEGTFFENRAFYQAISHVKKYNSSLHVIGLASTGSVHSSLIHLYALVDLCKKNELENVKFHLFTDGRDAPPKDGLKVIADIEEKLISYRLGQICSISGRYYAMDRDGRWQRTQKAYDAIVLGKGNVAVSPTEAVKVSYEAGQTDEFIDPVVMYKDNQPLGTVNDNDAVIFFNFRVDRPRQLTMAFVMSDFEDLKDIVISDDPVHANRESSVLRGPTFRREKWPGNVFFVTMTEYQKGLPVSAVAYPPEKAKTSLPQILSENGVRQMHLTESEKERMVTIYFDGLHEGKFPNEDVFIIPSPKVPTYDKKPEMSIYEVVNKLEEFLRQNNYYFYVLNFANPDMVAHSGNIKATIEAIEHVDRSIGRVAEMVLALDGTLFITADHGNAEELLTFPTTSFFFTTSKGDKNTDHSNNPVPFLIINNRFSGKSIKLPRGTLSDVAPTILTFMGLPVPPVMTGRNLLEPGFAAVSVPLSSELPIRY